MNTGRFIIRDTSGRFYMNTKSTFVAMAVKLPYSKDEKEEPNFIFSEEEKDAFLKRVNESFVPVTSAELKVSSVYFNVNDTMVILP